MAIIKKIPPSETGPSLCCKTCSGAEYIITQNPTSAKFTLWAVEDAGYEKIATASSPVVLDGKIPWR